MGGCVLHDLGRLRAAAAHLRLVILGVFREGLAGLPTAVICRFVLACVVDEVFALIETVSFHS